MIKLKLIPGTQEWLDTRLANKTASEAPAMMGKHKNISRTQLLDHKKGWTTEVDAFTQKLFDAGHETEELARPLAEALLDDDDFYVEVGMLEGTDYLASFDGLSTLGDIVFEHKLYNKTLAENVRNNKLEPHYFWQLEHQLLVSGADKCLFVTSDGTKDNWADMCYVSVPSRRAELIAGWEQFAKDLENHEPQAKVEKVVAEAITDLPTISYQMNGMSLTSNLDVFKTAATALVSKSKIQIETDQDFADADAMVKVFKATEAKIRSLIEQVVGEVKDIDSFTKDLKFIGEEIRQARLVTDKQVKARKEELRVEIASKSQAQIKEHESIFIKLGVAAPFSSISVIEAMKGKKTIDSLQDAADTAVSQIKIELDKWFHIANENAGFIQDYKDFKFLFADWKDIAFKANDDFQAMVKTRVAEHKQVESDRLEEQRAQIQREEEAKAQAKVEAEKAEAERLERANQAREAAKVKAAADAAMHRRAEQTRAEMAPQEIEQETIREAQQSVEEVSHELTCSREFTSNKPLMSLPTSKPKPQNRTLTAYDMGYIDGLTAYAKSGKEETLDVLIENYLQEKAA